MTLDETIYRLSQEANEWDWIRSSTKEDEENGFKCRFAEGSEEYARRVEEITQIANWLEELKTLRKAYELLALSFCKNIPCVFCECFSECKDSKIDERGRDITMRHFLQKAREE